MTILTVDDDIEDQDLFTEAVNIIDPSIICLKANDGIEGHELLFNPNTHLTIDYIFLDINMPKMNGIEFLTLIKKSELFNEIPVYMLSTSCSQSEKAKIILLGAQMLEKQSQFKMNISMLSSIIKTRPVVKLT